MANSTRKRMSVTWRWILLGPVASVLTLAITVQPSSRESVREELIRRQAQTGLTFAWVDQNTENEYSITGSAIVSGVRAVWFRKQSVIPLQDSLEAFRPDGFSFGDSPRFAADDLCWSHDQSRLVATLLDPPNGRLGILDLASKTTQTIEPQVEQISHVTSECWSPDDKQIVYETDDKNVRLFDTVTNASTALANGESPTWSPDGNWIAFLDSDTYYAVRADGTGRKKFFHKKGAESGLYWSPDSRIVAYVSLAGILEGGIIESNRLRFRRLDDNSEDSMAANVNWIANYHWITSSELVKRLEAETRRSK
jgi:WD40 repeat protein